MTPFRCIPIPSETAARFRRTGVDDGGNAVRRMVAGEGGGFPCRHCLRLAVPGEAMLLGSFHLPRPRGLYWTPSPVFVHADGCRQADGAGVPETVRLNTLVSVRAYDADGMCLYDLGQVCAGAEVEAPLQRALLDARTAFANVHTARPGCWLVGVERA